MFSLNDSMHFYLYTEPTDMRKNFDGLSGIVLSCMKKIPEDGSVYVFINKKRDKIKLLHWEPGGFSLYYKRLESGTLERPPGDGVSHSTLLKWSELVLIVEGIPLMNLRKRKRYSLVK